MTPYYQDSAVTIIHGDCREIVPTLGRFDLVLTDPPYGMGKAEWDKEIPKWFPSLVADLPLALFCGVIGMRDYPTPDWCGAWVRPASTQRIGFCGGFNNWEPILFYRVDKISNDTFVFPNNEHETEHPTQKPTPLFKALVNRTDAETILDPFAGSGTTGRAAKDLGRKAVLIELEERYCEIAAARMSQEVMAL